METISKNNTYKIIAIVAGIVILAGGLIAYTSAQKASAQKTKDDESAMMKKKTEESASMKKKEEEATMKKESTDPLMKKTEIDSSMKKDDTITPPTVTTATAPVTKANGLYIPFNADQAKAAAVDGNSVIFFHAPWCPTCKAAEADIKANLTKLDSKLTIFKTDYDTSTELKKQYGVTSQSTFVKIDKDGKLIKKGNGFTTVDAINSFAKN
jgi:thioredoxin 1